MLRVFQTGDNHIGLRYASHERADVLSGARIDAFVDMVECANSEQCDLFVITGDLFENTYGIAKRDVQALLDILSRFKGTVVMLPGNHDYYDKDSKLWQYYADIASGKDNLLLLSEFRPYELRAGDERVVIYPALCTSLHSEPGENNLGWMKAENIVSDETYRIGIAHGAIEGETIDREGRYFLMTRAELQSIPLDLWLIGHTHVPFPANIAQDYAECEGILNAGTHVQTDVSCNTQGSCFILEIDSDKRLRAKKYISGRLRFYRKHVELRAGEMRSILARELEGIAGNSVVELILSGAVSAAEYEERASIIEERLAGYLESTYNDSALSKLISKELIEAEFAETSFSAGLLRALLDEPKEAQLTYELLKALKEGK